MTRTGWPFAHPPNTQFRLNRQSPQAGGLVAWWPSLGNGGNLLRDYTGRGNNGALTNGASITSDGVLGQAISFDGTDDYVTVPHNAALDLDNASPWSISLWLRTSDVSGVRQIINKTPGSRPFWFVYTAFGAINYELFGVTSGSITGKAAPGVSANTLYAFVLTYDGSNDAGGIRCYLNGANVGVSTFSNDNVGSFANSSPLLIGQYSSSQYCIGQIADIRMYNRRLTDADVAHAYAPQTRYDLYAPIPRFWPVGIPPAGGGGAYELDADTGSYTLTGQAAGLIVARTLAADSGTYALTGQDANLLHGYSLAADAGSYTLTGQDATLSLTRVLAADVGTYTLIGQSANLLRGYALVADAGSYSLTGQDAALLVARQLTADAGTYAVAGQDASLTVARVLSLDAGAYTLTGQDVDLVHTQAGEYTLVADAGTYTVSGQAATLTVTRVLVADAGTYTLTGQDAGLLRGRTLTADAGSYALAGQDTTLSVGRVIDLDAGSYTVSGQDATLVYTPAGSYILVAETGVYSLAGQATNLLVTRQLLADTGVYTVTGQTANLLRGFLVAADAGVYVLSGQAIAFLWLHVLAASAGSYTIAGQAAALVWSGEEAPVTPAERTFVVEWEDRVFAIEHENRTYIVQKG